MSAARDLAGRVAVVVGGTSGIGRALAVGLAEAGADVVAVEPPGGAANRTTAGFHTWLRSKRSVVLDVEQPGDRARLDDLLTAAGSSFLSFDFSAGVAGASTRV